MPPRDSMARLSIDCSRVRYFQWSYRFMRCHQNASSCKPACTDLQSLSLQIKYVSELLCALRLPPSPNLPAHCFSSSMTMLSAETVGTTSLSASSKSLALTDLSFAGSCAPCSSFKHVYTRVLQEQVMQPSVTFLSCMACSKGTLSFSCHLQEAHEALQDLCGAQYHVD